MLFSFQTTHSSSPKTQKLLLSTQPREDTTSVISEKAVTDHFTVNIVKLYKQQRTNAAGYRNPWRKEGLDRSMACTIPAVHYASRTCVKFSLRRQFNFEYMLSGLSGQPIYIRKGSIAAAVPFCLRPPPLLSFCLGVVRHGQAFLRF